MSLNKLLILPLPILADLHFQTSPFIYRNRKISKVAFSFELLPTMQKSRRATSPCCNVVLETMPLKLHGRSHPGHNACKDRLPYGSRTTWMSNVEEVQWFLCQGLKGFKGSYEAMI